MSEVLAQLKKKGGGNEELGFYTQGYNTSLPYTINGLTKGDYIFVVYNGSGIGTITGGNVIYQYLQSSLNRMFFVIQATSSTVTIGGAGNVQLNYYIAHLE